MPNTLYNLDLALRPFHSEAGLTEGSQPLALQHTLKFYENEYLAKVEKNEKK